MMPRKKNYIDVYLNRRDMKELKHGKVAYIVVKGQSYAIHSTPEDKTQAKIAKLQSEINRLKYANGIKASYGGPRTKRPYHKKDIEFWSKGGNAVHMREAR